MAKKNRSVQFGKQSVKVSNNSIDVSLMDSSKRPSDEDWIETFWILAEHEKEWGDDGPSFMVNVEGHWSRFSFSKLKRVLFDAMPKKDKKKPS